ncbi:hypothetical protein VSQ32_19240 [Lachnospiraceae bacterium KK002]
MGEQAKKWLAEQMREKRISEEIVANVLGIPAEKFYVGTGEVLGADEFLRICAYLHIRPENMSLDE